MKKRSKQDRQHANLTRLQADQYLSPRKAGLDKPNKFAPLLKLVGSGRDLWADEHADEYVNRLREGWE